MLSKSVRIALFVLGAFALLGLSAGVTQAANRLLTGGDVNAHYAAAQVGTVKDFSLKARASAALGTSLNNELANWLNMGLHKSEPAGLVKIEFSGVITAMELGLWTIGDYQVKVTAETEVDGSPAVGDTVDVEAFHQADGTLVAHEIEAEHEIVVVDDQHDDKVSDDDDQSSEDDHGNSGSQDDDHDDDDDDDDDHDDGDDGKEEEECTEGSGGEHGRKP